MTHLRFWGVVLACGLGLAACNKVDSKQLEKTITEKMVAAGIEQSTVSCPDNVEAKKGAKFVCQVGIEGKTYGFGVEVTGVEGSRLDLNTNFVDGVAFPRKKLLDRLVTAVKEKIGAEPTIDCGTEPLLFAKDNKIYCAISQGENKGKLRVDTDGSTNISGWEIEAP